MGDVHGGGSPRLTLCSSNVGPSGGLVDVSGLVWVMAMSVLMSLFWIVRRSMLDRRARHLWLVGKEVSLIWDGPDE